MQLPLEITFRGLSKDDHTESLIREQIAKLEQVCDYISSCQIVVEKTQQHQRSGNPYQILIDIRVPPGHELVVKQGDEEQDMHKELPTIIREAFSAARRQLKELVEKQRKRTKTHPAQEMAAVVSKLYPDEGYGFLRTVDGREIYFHQNSVVHEEFERLEIGTGVRYVEQEGQEGPQASTVQIVDKPGARISKSEGGK